MDFAERTCGVFRGKRGNFISNSPCERWSRDHQTLFLTWERGGYRPHFGPWLFIAAHGQPILKELNALKFATGTKTMFFL
jgi:hypothetical protein